MARVDRLDNRPAVERAGATTSRIARGQRPTSSRPQRRPRVDADRLATTKRGWRKTARPPVGPMAEHGEAVERGEREGVGTGVGDGDPADKGSEVLVGEDKAGD